MSTYIQVEPDKINQNDIFPAIKKKLTIYIV